MGTSIDELLIKYGNRNARSQSVTAPSISSTQDQTGSVDSLLKKYNRRNYTTEQIQTNGMAIVDNLTSLINTWGTEYDSAVTAYTSRFQNRTGEYKDSYLSGSAEALQGFTERKKKLDDTARQIENVLNVYGDYLDADSVSELRQRIKAGRDALNRIGKGYSGSADFFGQFKDEAEYAQWQDTQFRTGAENFQERLDWYDKSETEIADLEALAKEYAHLTQQAYLSGSTSNTDAAAFFAGADSRKADYYANGRYHAGANSRNIEAFTGEAAVANNPYLQEAVALLEQNGFSSVGDLWARIEGLKAERTRYERGEGEWATYDQETELQTGFSSLETDRQLVKLQDQEFVDKAYRAANNTYTPSFEDLSAMDDLIYGEFTMDLGEDGQVYMVSNVDGSRYVERDGVFYHPIQLDPRYTQIDRLGVYLKASGEDKYRAPDRTISTWATIRDQGLSCHWDFLTPEEVSVYYGLKADSVEKADAYLKQMQSTLNHRYENAKAKGTVEQFEKSNLLERFGMNAWSIVEQLGSGLGNVVVMADAMINGKEIDAYSATYSGTRYANAVRGATSRAFNEWIPGEFLGMTAGDVYSAVASGVDSMVYNTIPLIGPAINATIGSASDVVDKYAQGASQDQIKASAINTFAIEMATESAGLEKMKLMKQLDVYAWTDWLWNKLKQGGVELGEEVLSYLGNSVADVINRRSQSDWMKITEKHKDDLAGANAEIFLELMKNGLSGFIAGMLGGTASTVKSTRANVSSTNQIGKTIKATPGGVEGLKGYGSQISQNGNNKGLGRYVSRLTDKSSAAKVGKAYRMTEASVREQNKAELSKTLQEQGYSEKQADQIAEAAVSSAAGWRLTEKQKSIWSAAQNDPDVVAAVKQALTGEESGVRRRNQMSEDFRQGVRTRNMANFQTVGNESEDVVGKELRRQLKASGIPVAEESAAVDPSASSPEERIATPAEPARNDSEWADLASPEMRQEMQEAFANGEITEEEYDDYLDALSEQQGMDGVTEEGVRLQEQNEAAKRAQDQADPYDAVQKENTAEHGGERLSTDEDTVIDLSSDNALSNRIGDLHGSKKYTVIQEYILEVLQNQPIILSDGRSAVVDRSDAQHIASRAGREKTPQIAEIKRIIETATLCAQDSNPVHNKFDHFWYYKANVRFDGETFPLYVNVGRAKNDGTLHVYDLTKKLRDTADQLNGLERPVGNALGNGISKDSIRNQTENVKQQIQAVLNKVSTNHAAQMERYTELKDSDPEFAQKFYDSLMDSPYYKQFVEYLKLTEELEQLETRAQSQQVATGASALATTENDGGANNGTGVLHGSSQRNDRASAGRPAGSVAGRAGQDQTGRAQQTERIREGARRRNIASDLRRTAEPVTGKSQGIESSTDNSTMWVVPQESWTEAMSAKARQIYEETGKRMVYVVGAIEIVGKDGSIQKARGVNTASSIFVRIDHSTPAEMIADHESFHGMLDFYGEQFGRSTILDGAIEEIRKNFTYEEMQDVLDRYTDALCGMYDGNDRAADSQYVVEELLADAYAGINFRGFGANKFGDAVRSFMRDNHMSRENLQDNGTEQPTGPPYGQKENTAEHGGERYSIEKTQFMDWSAQIDSVLRGKGEVGRADTLVVGNVENFLIDEGVENVVLAIPQRVVTKAKGGKDVSHSIKDSKLKKLESGIATAPVVVRDSRRNSLVFITEIKQGGLPVLVSFRESALFDGDRVHQATSIHLQLDVNSYLQGLSEDATVYFRNKNEPGATVGVTNNLRSLAANIKFIDDIVSNNQSKVKQQIQAVLNKVSTNHAAQMGRYTELKDSNPELAQKFYDRLMDSPYYKQFEEYLKLTEELDRLEKDSSSPTAPQNDGATDGFVERASMDDSVTEGEEAMPAEPARNDSSNREQAKKKLIEELRKMSPQDIMGDSVGQLIDQYTKEQPVKPQTPKVEVDRGNLRRAISSTLQLSKEDSAKLTAVLDEYTESVKPKRMPKKKEDMLDVESKPVQAKKQLRKTLMDVFSIPEGHRSELGRYVDGFADRIVKNGKLTEADRKAFFTRMYESGAMTVPADEYSAQAREYLKGGRIYVADSVVADFGDDWENMRRRAFASGIYLTRQRVTDGHQNAGIDMWNSDLAEQLPWLFDAEATDRRSMLERIVQVAEDGRDERVSLAEYISILAEDQRTSEDEILDDMERQMTWALKTFAETAQVEIELKDRNMRRVLQERQQNKEAAERRKAQSELRELQQRTLKTLQWLNRNRNRAPEELKAAWDEVLGDVDLFAVGAANEMNWSDKYGATWKDLAQMYKDAMTNDPNFQPSPELERIVTRLDASKIADMDLAALQDLYKAAVGLRTEFHNRNNVINDEMQRLFAEVYTDSKAEIEAAPGGFKGGKMAEVDKLFNLNQLTPMNVLQRMAGWDPNGAFYSMAKQLEKGERDMRAYSVAANGMLEDFLREHEDWVKRADGQGKDGIWYKVEIPELVALELGKKPVFGDTITVWMTPAQKVHLYLESKNHDNMRHMTGGRTFADKELYSEGKRQEALSQGRTIRLAPETVKQIVSDLTDEELELARLLDQYYNTFATKEINRVSNILYGYDKAMGNRYAPIYTNQNYTKTEFGVFDVTAEGVGNLKGRQYAVNPSYNISAFDAFERHVDQTARFCGMAIPARNWTTLMNWREKNNSTGDVITHKWGDEGKKYITDLITRLQAGDDVKNDQVSATLNKLQSNYISAVFGANPSIVLKQLGSIPLAGSYLGFENLPKPAQLRSIDQELIKKYTPDLAWRTMGYTNMETKMLKENPNWTETNKFVKFTFGGGAITAMDGWAASTLWPWAENKVRKEHPELEIGTQEQINKGESPFYKKVAQEFEDAVSRSQSVSDEIHQSNLRKSKNPLARMFTLFRSDSAQTYNAIRQKIGEAQYYARNGAPEEVQKSAKIAVGTAFGALMINALWGEVVSFLMALWKNKGKKYRDEEDDEMTVGSVIEEMVMNMFSSMSGTVVFGEEIFEIIGNIFTGEKWYGIDTPGAEQLNDLIQVVIDGGGAMRDFLSGAFDAMKNGGDLAAYFKKHDSDLLGAIKGVAGAAAMYLGGVPVSNVEAYLMGTLKWLSPELGVVYDDLLADPVKGGLAGLEGNALEGRMKRILGDRQVDCSKDTLKVLAQLYQQGEKSAFPGDTPKSITIGEESRTLTTGQQATYDTVWSSVVKRGLDELVASEYFQDADTELQTKMLKRLYSYAGARAKEQVFDDYELSASDAKTARIVADGATLAEYVAWSSLTGDMNDGEKFQLLSRWDVSDKGKKALVAAILGMEMETETGKPSPYAKFLDAVKDGLSVDGYVELRADGVDVDQYLKYTKAGLNSESAADMSRAMLDLEVRAGKDDVKAVQKWRAAIDSQNSVADQLAALSVVMSDAQYRRVEVANKYSIKPNTYVKVQEQLPKYDADGNGYYKQAEVKAAIDGISGSLSLTIQQKAVLWQLVSGNTSAKNNPYSTTTGWQVIDTLDKLKQEKDDKSLSFGELVAKQLMANL